MLKLQQLLVARPRGRRLVGVALLAMMGIACSSPVDSGDCAPVGGIGIELKVVNDATGESLADVAHLRVVPVDPPGEEREGRMNASYRENPLRVADRHGVYVLVVEAPGFERAIVEVTVREDCEIITEKVTIRMKASKTAA